jgi:Fe-S cluster assembly iron-binding protein IscA
MVLDEPKADDEIFKESGLTYAIEKKLYEEVKPINLDFVQTPRGSGYRISSNMQKSCGSCSC